VLSQRKSVKGAFKHSGGVWSVGKSGECEWGGGYRITPFVFFVQVSSLVIQSGEEIHEKAPR